MSTIQHEHQHRPVQLHLLWYVVAAVLTGAAAALLVATLHHSTPAPPANVPAPIAVPRHHPLPTVQGCFAHRHDSTIELLRSGCEVAPR